MKTKITIILFLSILLLSNLYAQDNYKKLQQKIDSLETKLEKIYIDQVENNPYTINDILNWGTGFFVGGKTICIIIQRLYWKKKRL